MKFIPPRISACTVTAVLPAGLFLVLQASSFAQSTWTRGGTNDLWSNTNNWAPASVPTNGASVIVDRSGSSVVALNVSPTLNDWSSAITGSSTTVTPSGASRTLAINGTLTKTGVGALIFRDNGGSALTNTVGVLDFTSPSAGVVTFGEAGNGLSSLSITTANVTGTNNQLVFLGKTNSANLTIDTLNMAAGATVVLANGGVAASQYALNVGSLNGAGGSVRAANGAPGQTQVATLNLTGTSNGSYGGIIEDGSAITRVVKSGSGTQTLSGINAFSGGLSVNGGSLAFAAQANLSGGLITLGGGTLLYTASTNRILTNTFILTAGTTSSITVPNAAGFLRISNVISGTGALVKAGSGTLALSVTNSYTGDTTVNDGTLILSASGSLAFVVGGSGTNNRLHGTGTATLNGQFVFNLAGASTNTNASWTIVSNSLTATYGTNFLVTGFSGAGGNWTNTTNGVNYVFAQSNGVLSVQSTGAPVPYASWVSYWQGVDPNFTNTAGTDNPDGDPFDNNEEFAFDGNPTIGTGALLTVTKIGPNAVFHYVAQTNTNAVTYQVQNTTNLAAGPWTNSAVTISNAANQGGISQTNIYHRKEFVVPATTNDFYRVKAAILAP
jgi:fibronectin-binding autotransporter adhesin